MMNDVVVQLVYILIKFSTCYVGEVRFKMKG